MNPKNGEIELMCEGGEPCSRAIMDEIKRDKEGDILQNFKVNKQSSGSTYGFITPKNGNLVFKYADPPEEGGKLERGKECAIVSTMTGHILDLKKLGDILKTYDRTDFDLNDAALRGSRKIKNATRACTLMNLILRYMDADKLRSKKWFFRPVFAKYIGYKGFFRAAKK
jgi:hypothetical protein